MCCQGKIHLGFKKNTKEVSLKYTDYMLKQYFGYTGLNRIIEMKFTCLKNFVMRFLEHLKLHVAPIIFLLGQGVALDSSVSGWAVLWWHQPYCSFWPGSQATPYSVNSGAGSSLNSSPESLLLRASLFSQAQRETKVGPIAQSLLLIPHFLQGPGDTCHPSLSSFP